MLTFKFVNNKDSGFAFKEESQQYQMWREGDYS